MPDALSDDRDLPPAGSTVDPRLQAAAAALLTAGLAPDTKTAARAATVALAAADAVPAAVRREAAVATAAATTREAELAAGGAARGRSAFLRVALATVDAWEHGGWDSSAMLSCLPADLEQLVRVCRTEPTFDPCAGPSAVLGFLEDRFGDQADDDVEAATVRELLQCTDEAAWRVRYRAGVAALMGNLLPSAELTEDEWACWLDYPLADLHAMGQRALVTISLTDLAAAGIAPAAGGHWTGLPLD